MEKTQIVDLIVHYARQVVPALADHDFSESDRLSELGANSVDRAEITMLVQESLDLSIPRVALFGPKNIGELAELFVQSLHVS